MKLKIRHEGKEGYVKYDEKNKEVEVYFPDDFIETEVYNYLNNKRVFRIPESNRIDDFREDLAYPYDNMTYFELAMSSLWGHTGVLVDWG